MTATVSKPLHSLTASDLMSDTVFVLPAEMSLQGAARLLSRANITGAPVVDAEGRCIGVLSATDFLHLAEKGPTAHGRPAEMFRAWEIVNPADLPDDSVRSHMTADPVMVARNTSLVELARRMLDAHIHRVIVADRDKKPVGIVSSTDILAAIARADG